MIETFYNKLLYIGALLYYEVPMVYVTQNTVTKDLYLHFELRIGDDGDSYKWLIFKTSKNDLKQFIANKFSFFELSKKRFKCDVLGDFGITTDINVKTLANKQVLEFRNIQTLPEIKGVYGEANFNSDCCEDENIINFINNL
jgi:hypothetical protein